MAEHTHHVTDTDAHFQIDAITRSISAVSGKSALIQGDHNSERFSFELSSRIIEGHDMSLCNVVQVHYINIDSATKAQSIGVYDVDDLEVSKEDENKVTLSWLISANATLFAGSLNFLIKFKCVADNGTVEYVWNSGIFKGISVSEGIDNGEAIAVEYSDILEQWRNKLMGNLQAASTVGWVTLPAAAWEGSDNLYSQIVSIDGVTENSRVNLTPSVEQLAIFYNKDITFVTENDGGVVTVYVIGQKPQNDYIIQADIVEVSV